MSIVKITNEVDVTQLLRQNSGSRGRAINELRHRATNYDEVIGSLSDSADYESVAEAAREIVYQLIDSSTCTKYEKYLFRLYNKKWDFHKKSAISLRGER